MTLGLVQPIDRFVSVFVDTIVTNTITPYPILSFSVVAGKTYIIDATVQLDGTSNTGTKHGMSFPTGIVRVTRKRASSYSPINVFGTFDQQLGEPNTYAKLGGVFVCQANGNVSLTIAKNALSTNNLTLRNTRFRITEV